ncbi:hypothetical protein WAF17_04390 [Bernardetia sp. ABR2-2B]|uniref:hypothetical protein n=1 Tax=Bernardetia sp. ABR2-2B TaxID=3127472 RepID=UPI0030CBADB9
MKNQSKLTIDLKQIHQIIGVGVFLCLNLTILNNLLETLFNWISNFLNIGSFYLFALSQYLILSIVLSLLYFSLQKIKEVISQRSNSLQRTLIFTIISYVVLYVIATGSPMLYGFFISDNYNGEITPYFEMRSQNYVESLFVYYSISILKFVVMAFIFLRERKKVNFYSETSKVLDKD